MNDNIDKNEIRRAIDRLQKEHPAHFSFDVTVFDDNADFSAIQRAVEVVAKKCRDDAEINIICEMAKLYIEGVRPMVKPKYGEWVEKPSYKEDKELGIEKQVVCSKCDEQNSHYVYGKDGQITGKMFVCSRFCPNCGAKMISSNSETEKSNDETEKSNDEKSCLNCGTSEKECELGNRARHGFCGNWTERK